MSNATRQEKTQQWQHNAATLTTTQQQKRKQIRTNFKKQQDCPKKKNVQNTRLNKNSKAPTTHQKTKMRNNHKQNASTNTIHSTQIYFRRKIAQVPKDQKTQNKSKHKHSKNNET